MIRMPRAAMMAMAALMAMASAAQSIELAMRLPQASGADPAFGEIESGAMDKFFDAGIVLTTGMESPALDIPDLCSKAQTAYIDWLLVLDVSGAALDPSPSAKAESLVWYLYKSKDGRSFGSSKIGLPAASSQLSERLDRLRALGDAAATSVLSSLRSQGLSAPGADQSLGSAGG